MDSMEEQLHAIRTEWNIVKEKWFVGEKVDPVFEGTVRDFCQFDNTLRDIYTNVEIFMRGVEQMCEGVATLSDSVITGLGQYHDGHIATESCKLREASHQITRTDAPHSAIAKLRRDMDFNILNPLRTHLLNNRNLKTNLDVRRRRLLELTSSKKPLDLLVQKNIPKTDPKFCRAKSHYESAKEAFQECDRQVFEWLYILEDYKGDILDSTLQTLKYLQYEFFASGAHSISAALPARMEFRPMVEMTPDHLEAQVELELREQEEEEAAGTTGIDKEGTEEVHDYSLRLIEKMAKDAVPEPPLVSVDPLSLASLVGQGFDDGAARKALRMHNNDTQLALDWLVDGPEKRPTNSEADGVRLPTTIKRIQKLRARRRKIAAAKEKKRQQEKEDKEKQDLEDRKKTKKKKKKGTDSDSSESEREPSKSQASVMDLIGLDEQRSDLLSLDEIPTTFSPATNVTSLPQRQLGILSSETDVLTLLQQGHALSAEQLVAAQQQLLQQAKHQAVENRSEASRPNVTAPMDTLTDLFD